MKKVFLDDLPKWKTDIRYNGTIKWKDCIGYKVRFIYDDIEGQIEIINYESKSQILTIKYNNKKFYIVAGNFSKCALGNLLGKKTTDFKIEIGTHYKDEKRDITITDRTKVLAKNGQWMKYYKYHCNKCGFDCGEHYSLKNKRYEEIYLILEYNLEKGQGCACCCTPPQIAVLGKNTIYDTDPWLIPIINDDEFCKTHTHSCSDSIYPVCPECGHKKSRKMKISTIYTYHSIGCICSDGKSYPEKIMISVLKQLNENFEMEKHFKWCVFKNYRTHKDTYGIYDFIIKNKKNIIETDGTFHTKYNGMNGQTAEESKYIDDEKDRLAKEHGYKVIRIDCKESNLEYIKQNILIKLNKLFDLNNIDWNKCNEFALSNLVKEACEYKKNNPDMTTTEIGKIIGVKKGTICRWLKQGNGIWCDYDPKEEQRKRVSKNGKLSGKIIEVFKNNISLGIFESASELSRQSEKLFGVKFTSGGITRICRGERPHYKGYIFKFCIKIMED